ncbi:hypothetical protein [Fischerella thermalis]|jgi:hypothetical protein|uniref:hypothetical protein n=1 Tax=Fischerella thermalis TaxID=372787 RepID=UPI000C80BCB3|nr:hypothetical protein [Fischerella thermalis]MBF1988269.1 hypothetical protein [Fischerella thermalis M58_A2018_009]MBF2062539.1 hypothetical protein [Fischerella thermalis M66_A2018_004]MBF2071560.1 hypothetical protein [Fischerella thermalis M48_A2018_028]PLZ93612.1 hypothetical protein CI593_02200 [Fischerella thermalis CCMEE 5194]
MKTLTNSLNNMRWNRLFTFALSFSILLFAQACNPRYAKLDSPQPTGETSVNYPLNQAGN